MNTHPQLESVPDKPGQIDSAAARRIYDLEEEVAELEVRIAERLERERVLTLELAAARRDLEVKAAYNVMLERSAVERQQQLTWLQSHVEHLTREQEALRTMAQTQAGATEAIGRDLAAAHSELAAERARVSYRLTQRLIGRLNRYPRLRRTGGRFYRLLVRRGNTSAR